MKKMNFDFKFFLERVAILAFAWIFTGFAIYGMCQFYIKYLHKHLMNLMIWIDNIPLKDLPVIISIFLVFVLLAILINIIKPKN